MSIERSVIMVTHTALIGGIGRGILGISVIENDTTLEMHVFHQFNLSDDQLDALQVATTEILATVIGIYQDVPLVTHLVTDKKVVPRIGEYVFLQLGIEVARKT